MQTEKRKDPFRVVIEKDGEVVFDKQASTIFCLVNDGEAGANYIRFRRSDINEVVNVLSHLRALENTVLNTYPEALRPALHLLLAKIKPRKAGEADETNEEDRDIPLFKLEDN